MTSTTSTRTEGSWQATAARIAPGLAAITAALILVQAVLAGRHLFGTWSITVHGVLGNVTFMVAVILAVAITVTRTKRAAWTGWILVILLTAQIGLGYSSRSSLEAGAWHIPLGVAAFGLAVWLTSSLRLSSRL